MKGLEQARHFLMMAEKDGRALRGMEDGEVFSAEIFGFHVQQAVEKVLKAWLCALDVSFPRTHDLEELGALLEEAGREVPEFVAELLEFTDFAVAFRYEAFSDLDADIDRRDCIERVDRLLQHVRAIVAGGDP
ncbi:MAG TPA: HEPN domain-containing protein [Sedimentisphaerales bacterium]|nr:HEPN domain-containing protein [Sedimentisphaerales bacterium]HRS10048.1 HEPN domain-containing protein [Sedimentisphaerales bacterium]HRV46754.1 HEPN domain-containing protein [Sedimentisphaerales bacterium]